MPKAKTKTLDKRIPTIQELECLIMHPDGSDAAIDELCLVTTLQRLCVVFGTAHVFRITTEIKEIWRDPSLKIGFINKKREYLAKRMAKLQKKILASK